VSTKTVKFTEDFLYETSGRNAGPEYKAGQVESFREDVADRFVRRGVAVEHDGRGEGRAAFRSVAPEPPAPQPTAQGQSGKK
jgi:hypothetical protein